MKLSPISFGFLNRNPNKTQQPLTQVSEGDHIRDGILMALSTHLGDRPLAPHYGSRLRNMAFQQITKKVQDDLVSEVRRCIETCEPRVRISNITLTESKNPDEGLSVEIQYYIIVTKVPQSLTFSLKLLE